MNYFIRLKNYFNKITELKYFDEIYTAVIALVGLLGWCFSSMTGISIIIILAALVLLLTEDLKYVIPNVIYSLFCINEGFANDVIPIPIIVAALVFILILSIQTIKNGIHLSKMKSWIGLAGLAISNMIPIFWADNIPKENSIFYVFFFIDLIYFVIYVIFTNGIKKNSINMLAHTMTWLGIILTIECAVKVVELRDTVENILSLWYHLGWGLCNEAGIMMVMSIPFTFYLIGKSNNSKYMMYNHFKVVVMLVGILLTTSRGSFIFGSLETIALLIALFFVSDNKKVYKKTTGIYLGAVAALALICCLPIYTLSKDIIKYIFHNGMNDSARYKLWDMAYNQWITNPRNVIFGPGFNCIIQKTNSGGGFQVGPIVFHSTLFETLAIGGVFGLITLNFHFYEKYRAIYVTKNKLIFTTLLIGFILIDLYGMIDNTYHMYYFMIPMVIGMTCVDNLNNDKIEVEAF